MKALIYLLITRMKNKIISLKKKPAMLVLYLVIFAMLLFSVIIMVVSNREIEMRQFADERILYLIVAGLGLLYLWIFTNTGLSTGSSLFTMPDVGLLFVAPLSTKKILMYGLLSTLGKSLLGSIFIFYQIGNLKSNFGYGFKEIFGLFIVFALMVLFCQLLSIGIYIFSNGNPMRKKIVWTLLYSLFAIVILAAVLIQQREQIGILDAFLELMDQSWFGYIPVAGWTTMFLAGVVHNSLPMILIPLILFLVAGGMIVSLLTMGAADYYEDVLVSTETTYLTLKAAKEGRSVPKNNLKKIKIKDNDQGLKHGSGANTLFYRHMLEMRRKSRLIYIDSYTMFLVLGVGVASYYFKRYDAPAFVTYGVLGTAIYMQFIFSMMGKLKGELIKPFIFMIPEKSITKVFAASLTSLIKHAVDGATIFLVLAVVGGSDPFQCFFSALAYTASGAVFVALTILYQRVLGGQPNKIVQMFLSFGLLTAVMAPAIGASVLAGILLPTALDFLCTLPFTIFCLLIAELILVTCGNLIDKSEFTGKI